MRFRLLAFLLLLLAAPALAGKGAWRARLTVEAGADSNARRVYGAPGNVAADALVAGLGSVDGTWSADRLLLAGSYELGARKFLRLGSEDTLVQAGLIQADWRLARELALGLRGRAKDRHGAQRDYTDLAGSAVLTWSPDPQLELGLSATAERFLYWRGFEDSFGAGSGGLTLRYRLDRRHGLVVAGEVGERRHAGQARPPPGSGAWTPRRRQDGLITASLTYGYRGPFALSVGYGYLGLTSNSFGETLLRHRVTATVGVPLWFDITLLGQVGLQVASYPDGVFLSPDLILLEDDENQNSATLKLARPLTKSLELELRYAVYQNRLDTNDLDYFRQLATIGLSWRIR